MRLLRILPRAGHPPASPACQRFDRAVNYGRTAAKRVAAHPAGLHRTPKEVVGPVRLAQRHRSERRSRLLARFVALSSVATVLLVCLSSPSDAHPLGNFTKNTSASVQIRPKEVLVDYVIDLAEVPTLQARPDIDRNGDDSLSAGERRRYAEKTCDSAAGGLKLSVDKRSVALERRANAIAFPKGIAGLSTLRLECDLRATGIDIKNSTTLRLSDGNFGDRLGWREIIAVGDRTTITDTDALRKSTSDRLTRYPKGQLTSPLRQRDATITVKPGGPAAGARKSHSPIPLPSADRLTSLLTERTLTIPFAIFALAVSFILGGFHAVAPGHGKTVMAAYLVGQRGARRQALLLGATVAVTHTGGVLALALVASNSAIAPERFYPILGSVSGVLVIVIGVVLFRRAVEFRRIFPTLGPGASHHFHHGIGGHTHSHDDEPVAALVASPSHADHEHGRATVSVATAGHGHGDHAHEHSDHEHEHSEHGHEHADHGHEHGHGHDDHKDGPAHGDGHGHDLGVPLAEAVAPLGPGIQMRSMMAMGFAGGLVPSPSALVVLLGAIAIGRAWFGLLLIVAYGAGLAAVLVGAGLMIERLRHRVEPFLARRSNSRLAGLAVNLPVITAVLVVLGGVYLMFKALALA